MAQATGFDVCADLPQVLAIAASIARAGYHHLLAPGSGVSEMLRCNNVWTILPEVERVLTWH